MCGIAGFYSKKEIPEERINRTLKLMENRGPDCQDVKIFRNGSQNRTIGLLHSRLSIIDLDPRSNQPFAIGNQTIVFNGEIYNYLELSKELERKGIQLITESDTEVLLHYFRIHGQKCVEFFEGMWAFAIYNSENETLFLSRDRFAEKPLYYHEDKDGFYFGSEVKFLKSLVGKNFSVNYRHLTRHLAHGYKSLYKTEDTYFKEVRELKYAQNLTIDLRGVSTRTRYWHPNSHIASEMSLHDSIEGSKEALINSVKVRLRADVPLAFCLSGGVDSAGLASIAAKELNGKVTSFSIIDSDERYNEEDNIMATVRDIACEYHLISVAQDEPIERLIKLVEYHDSPIATITYYTQSLITEAIHEKGFKVAFSGTSADELFTGYYDHFLLHLNEVRKENNYEEYLVDWRNNIQEHIRNPTLKDPNLYAVNPGFRNHIFDGSEQLKDYLLVDFKEAFKEKSFCQSLLRNRTLNELFHEAIPVILHEEDLNSMFYSVENRSPYLDSRLQEFTYSIPPKHLIKNGYGKFILREALKGILNEKVRLDRRKKGFNASINSIINFNDSRTISYLLDPSAKIFEFVNRKKIKKLFELFPIPNHLSKFIFNFINARIFLEMHG
jgi:asparagine synthase (glutamine-hydrolysing)